MIEYDLTKSQQRIADAIANTNANILVHGEPGTGKSVIIRYITENTSGKYWHLAAPTGLAAINIMGKTLHSLFRLPVSKGIIHHDYDVFPTDYKVISAIRSIKHLIIDEISMVRADTLQYIHRLMCFCNEVSVDVPFGGAQVVAVGDFFQLPPVVQREEMPDMKSEFGTPFAFSAPVFSTFKIMTLNETLRQKDPVFINILNEARTGRISMKSLAKLNACVKPVEDVRIRLVGTNSQADLINTKFLNDLPGEEFEFNADINGEWKAYPVEPVVKLRVGAQVMVKKNKSDVCDQRASTNKKAITVNGSIGVVTSIEPEMHDEVTHEVIREAWVTIKLTTGETVNIYRQGWEQSVKRRNESGKWENVVVASYEQMPLALAWAISIHKSQGQSFDVAHVDSTKIFAAGQLYVALSRCRSLEGLSLEARVDPKKFYADSDVVEFFDNL